MVLQLLVVLQLVLVLVALQLQVLVVLQEVVVLQEELGAVVPNLGKAMTKTWLRPQRLYRVT